MGSIIAKFLAEKNLFSMDLEERVVHDDLDPEAGDGHHQNPKIGKFMHTQYTYSNLVKQSL